MTEYKEKIPQFDGRTLPIIGKSSSKDMLHDVMISADKEILPENSKIDRVVAFAKYVNLILHIHVTRLPQFIQPASECRRCASALGRSLEGGGLQPKSTRKRTYLKIKSMPPGHLPFT